MKLIKTLFVHAKLMIKYNLSPTLSLTVLLHVGAKNFLVLLVVEVAKCQVEGHFLIMSNIQQDLREGVTSHTSCGSSVQVLLYVL